MDPAHGPPLQARVAAANGTVSQLANCCNDTTILAHMEWNRGKRSKMNWTGANDEKVVGMAGKMAGRQNTAC